MSTKSTEINGNSSPTEDAGSALGTARLSQGTAAEPMQTSPPSLVHHDVADVPGDLIARAYRESSVLDRFVLAYLTLLVAAAVVGTGAARASCIALTATLWITLASALLLVRGGVVRHPTVGPLIHRVALYGTFQASYFFLRDLLPLASPHSVDPLLHRIDLALFGVEPTLIADRFVTPATTEWFSFFYYSYFFLLVVHVVPFVFGGKNRGLFPEFALAIIVVYGLAQLTYFLVPGYGPYHALAGAYGHHQLPSGLFHDLVMQAVAAGGAQKDIFPSLHTAGPFTIALFSFLHRDRAPFRYTWPVMAFFSLQIIGATIFLRWHWAVDVVAGILLSLFVTLLAGPLVRWEAKRRESRGLSPTWGDIEPAHRAGPADEDSEELVLSRR